MKHAAGTDSVKSRSALPDTRLLVWWTGETEHVMDNHLAIHGVAETLNFEFISQHKRDAASLSFHRPRAPEGATGHRIWRWILKQSEHEEEHLLSTGIFSNTSPQKGRLHHEWNSSQLTSFLNTVPCRELHRELLAGKGVIDNVAMDL